MDIFTKGALWDYWKLGSDEIKPTNDETSDHVETDHDDEQDIGEIFRIETNLFYYETPLCKEFKEFNYILKIYHDLLTKYIKGFETYEEFKDDWIYEWNNDVPWDYKWYEALKDGELKEEALRNKAILEGIIDDDDESSYERRKYEEEYDAVKEDEYDDLTSTSKDACRAYQEIFRMMDEGWMVTRAE
uniref:Uncharacterized protein n=1 Tax=Tanacetum cinerariifolium TaxID=118510 RepID=A0A6L2J2Z6_TANCI|nr:hypothetical protein [Tanacetum cinerariifolium]